MVVAFNIPGLQGDTWNNLKDKVCFWQTIKKGAGHIHNPIMLKAMILLKREKAH